MNEYKVLWFDDEHESFESLKDDANQKGIKLIGYTNAEEGIAELESNLISYDAVIVDGKFYKNASATGDAVNDAALFNVARFLDKREGIKKIPWFIFSGQPDFLNSSNPIAAEYKGNKVYNKNFDADIEQLWMDIKKEADQQPDTQIRHKYHRVFEVCTEKYIGEHAYHDLLSILKKENSEKAFTDPNLYFNPLRKIMDDLFMASNKYGLMPDVFVKPSVALNESSKFLSGIVEKGYKLDTPVFPKVVSDHVRCILAVCQPASHRSELDSFISQVNTPYLLMSVTYQLLDVLLWFKDFIDANTDIVFNKTKYMLVDTSSSSIAITGTIEQDRSKNYHCGEIIINYTQFNKNGFKIGDTIRILKVANNTNEKTMHQYPKSAVQTEKI